jgi:hypothetical protein
MDKTITIRVSRAQDKALTLHARTRGKSRSQIIREFIDRGLEDRPLGPRIAHVKGALGVPEPKSGWQRRIKERNWR